jgi:redox-sensitive bicupin YhaK (pirin superfamily)
VSGRRLDRLARVVVRRDLEIHRSHLGPYTARWHFSFADYQDPTHIGIGALRVFNHEELPPAARLVLHPHSHAQCVTYVIAGEFQHRDAVLDSGRLDAAGVQRMTLTSTADYLEWNPSATEGLELLQIWLAFERSPTHLVEQRQYRLADRENRWLQVARPHGHGGSGLAVDSDASVLVTHLDPGRSVHHVISPARGGYAYVIAGAAGLNEHRLEAGDAAVHRGGNGGGEAHRPSELMLVDTQL